VVTFLSCIHKVPVLNLDMAQTILTEDSRGLPQSLHTNDWVIQGDKKVTQPLLKYLLMVEIQYNLIGLINTHIAVTIQEPTYVTSCYNLLAPVGQLSSNSRSARMSFSQVQ
jgi:hypothetical protein